MKKACMKFAVVCMAVLILLSGCTFSHSLCDTGSKPLIDYEDYEAKKRKCMQSVIENIELIDGIVMQLETYDFDVWFWYEENNVQISSQLSNAKREQVQSNEKLMNDLFILFKNEYIGSVTKVKSNNETEYFYTVDFISIAEGESSFAKLITDPKDVVDYYEHITGDWYFISGPYI